MSKQSISISTGTIVRTIFILLIVGFLFLVKDVIILFFVAIILSSAFDPLIDWLQHKKIPRTISILGVYAVFLTLVAWSLYLLAGPIVEQIKEIGKAFPDFYSKLTDAVNYLRSVDQSVAKETVSTSFADITKSLTSATSGIFRTVSSIFGGVFSFLMVLVVTFYLTVEEGAMKRFIKSLTPPNHQPYVSKLIIDMQHRMGYWLRGQLFLSIIVFAMVYIGLSLMGIKYALILALVAGVFEIVPFLGPWISAIPGVFFAFSQSPSKAIAVAILYFLVQQIENNLIVPKVMGRTTGLNPLVVILAILTGARLGGVVGALLAVPVALALAVYIDSILDKRKK